MAEASNGFRDSASKPPEPTLLAHRFPVNSLQEMTLSNGEVVSGRVYCTDEMTSSIVLQKALVHTTLATDIRIIAASSVTKSVVLSEEEAQGEVQATPISQPLSKIQKKALEERERRAIRLAEDSLRHINQKASPVGQAVFDRLLKGCGADVKWKDETSILVLNQIQVDPPYGTDNCHIVSSTKKGSLERSLERVKMIVTAQTADSSNTNSG